MDIVAAKKDGYSEDQIMSELGRRTGMDYQSALKDGHSKADVWAELLKRESAQKETPPQPDNPGFVQAVMTDLNKRATNMQNQTLTRPEGIFRDAGQIAGGVGDTIGDTIGHVVKAIVPDSVQSAIGDKFKQFCQTGAGKWFLGAMQAGEKTYGDFKKKHPDIAADFEAGVNIASIFPMGKAANVVELGLKRIPAQLEKDLKNTVTAYLPKTGIKATSVKNQGAIQAFNDASTKAVGYIAENKGELGVLDKDGNEILTHPTNADEFSQAVQGAKKKIWGEKIQPLLDKVGNPKFSTKPITDDLEKIIDPSNKNFSSIQRHFPDAIGEIKRLIDSYKEMGEGKGLMGFEQLEPELQTINNKLKVLKKGVNEKLGADDQALLTAAGHLRNIEDKMVQGIEGGGEGIKEAKKTWGALKHIEERVASKANSISGKKYSQGFLGHGYLGAVSTLEMIGGVVSGSSSLGVTGLATRAVAVASSITKDPNHIIKAMFKKAGKIVEKQKLANSFYNSSSRMFGNSEAQGVGQSIKQVTLPGAAAAGLQTSNPERVREWGE